MENQNLTVRQLLAMLAERIEQDANGTYVCMQDAAAEGHDADADELAEMHDSLADAVNCIERAVVNLEMYHDRLHVYHGGKPLDEQDYYDDYARESI